MNIYFNNSTSSTVIQNAVLNKFDILEFSSTGNTTINGINYLGKHWLESSQDAPPRQ